MRRDWLQHADEIAEVWAAGLASRLDYQARMYELSRQIDRLCPQCGANRVEHRKRICTTCRVANRLRSDRMTRRRRRAAKKAADAARYQRRKTA